MSRAIALPSFLPALRFASCLENARARKSIPARAPVSVDLPHLQAKVLRLGTNEGIELFIARGSLGSFRVVRVEVELSEPANIDSRESFARGGLDRIEVEEGKASLFDRAPLDVLQDDRTVFGFLLHARHDRA